MNRLSEIMSVLNEIMIELTDLMKKEKDPGNWERLNLSLKALHTTYKSIGDYGNDAYGGLIPYKKWVVIALGGHRSKAFQFNSFIDVKRIADENQKSRKGDVVVFHRVKQELYETFYEEAYNAGGNNKGRTFKIEHDSIDVKVWLFFLEHQYDCNTPEKLFRLYENYTRRDKNNDGENR